MAAKEVELKQIKNGQTVDDDEPVQSHVVPPDGGYGWVIMGAAFLCNVVVDGIIFSIGLVVAALADSFEVEISKATWVGSLLSGFYLIAGPFVSALSNRYGFRVVTIMGAILGSISLAVSVFATSIEFLYISIGVVGGIGFGLVYVPAVVAVGYYFDKRRALATGIAVCGSGVGTFVIAPLTTWLLEQYGWRGTILMLAGLILNCAVFGSLFRPLEPVKSKRQRKNAEVPAADGTPLMARIKRERDENLRQSEAAENSANGTAQDDDFRSSTKSLTNVKLVGIKAKRSSLAESSDGLQEKRNLLDEEKGAAITKSASKRSIQASNKSLNKSDPRPMDRADAFFTGSVQRLPEYREDPANYHASVTRIPDVQSDESTCCSCLPDSARRTLLSMMDFTLFESASFVLICISAFLTFMGFFVPFMFLAVRAENGGASKESASLLLSIVGVTNTIGRIICGAVADHPKVSVLLLNNIALTLCGVVTILTPFMPSYEMLVVYACLFGFSIAGIVSIRSILLVELLGLDKLTNSFGLMLPFTGVSACVGGPLAGMFYDATKDFDASFYLAGSVVLLSGLLCYPLGVVNRWEKRRRAVKPVPEPVPTVVSS